MFRVGVGAGFGPGCWGGFRFAVCWGVGFRVGSGSVQGWFKLGSGWV